MLEPTDGQINDAYGLGGQKPQVQVVVLWLIAAALAAFFLTLYLVFAGARYEVAELQAELAPLEATLAAFGTPQPRVAELMKALAEVEETTAKLREAESTLATAHVAWPEVMAAIGDFDPVKLELVSLAQTGQEIVLQGQAADDASLTRYTQGLEASGLVDRVTLQSMKALPTPGAKAAAVVVPNVAARMHTIEFVLVLRLKMEGG
ncbi:MAG: PilN domain-containing protein [Anaerolineae bacterium]